MSAVVCHMCDSPDTSWFGQLGSTQWYRCQSCHEFSVGPDPYCVDFGDDE